MMKSLDAVTGVSHSPVTATPDLFGVIKQLAPAFAARADAHDRTGEFVADNYRILKEHRFFAALVPAELGGLGVEYTEMCHALRELAHYCPSTALAVSMHSHLVATTVWK